MTLLVGAAGLEQRTAVSHDRLHPLARSLAADLDEVIAREIEIPREKARLTRVGGRCGHDGALLDFDPWSPRLHRCGACGRQYSEADHYRAWIYWYQLWLAERAVHGALLGALLGEERYLAFTSGILDRYARMYLDYPNVDNVLGPSRPFFSTYLESIWLLQICVALDILEGRHPARFAALGGLVRDRIIAPSADLIAGYDEGLSNRQVWNNAALFAAGSLLGHPSSIESSIHGGSGLSAHVEHSLLSDGTWYEGENYHLFAHRGLWYLVTMSEVSGFELPDRLRSRFQEGFAAPFLTTLPDMTFPSRRDSQYRISLRQWRIAEHCELGLARRDDERLGAVLARIYSGETPRRDTGRSRSSAESERNMPASGLDRSALGWKSLLFARPELPPLAARTLDSVLLEGQGVGVIRRDEGEVYVALDYGTSGGGHGHPDRLNLLFSRGETRWLDDVGTGSYFDPRLRWYRSTLAHNAPFMDRASQWPVDGSLLGFADRGGSGWVAGTAVLGPGSVARRAAIVMADYLVDDVRWYSRQGVRFDLPLHSDLRARSDVVFARRPLAPEVHADPGFDFVTDAEVASFESGLAHPFTARDVGSGAEIGAWIVCDGPFDVWRLTGPGPPGELPRTFVLIECARGEGMLSVVWDWGAAIARVEIGEQLRIVRRDGAVHSHRQLRDDWSISILAGGFERDIVLEGRPSADSSEGPAGERTEAVRDSGVDDAATTTGPAAIVLRRQVPHRLTMGEAHYRRSEEDWASAGRPGAEITLVYDGRALQVGIRVERADRTFVAGGNPNPLDNEEADVNGAGVQLYLGDARVGWMALMIVPEEGSRGVRSRPIAGWESFATSPRLVSSTWSAIENGYELALRVDLGAGGGPPVGMRRMWLDLIVNEKPEGRERRRGQLVLSGGKGEFVYLRGDRHGRDRLIPLALKDD